MDIAEIEIRKAFTKSALNELRNAYIDIVNGTVKSYTLNGRSLTGLDLDILSSEIKDKENEYDTLCVMLAGGKRRKAVGIIPRDW